MIRYPSLKSCDSLTKYPDILTKSRNSLTKYFDTLTQFCDILTRHWNILTIYSNTLKNTLICWLNIIIPRQNILISWEDFPYTTKKCHSPEQYIMAKYCNFQTKKIYIIVNYCDILTNYCHICAKYFDILTKYIVIFQEGIARFWKNILKYSYKIYWNSDPCNISKLSSLLLPKSVYYFLWMVEMPYVGLAS